MSWDYGLFGKLKSFLLYTLGFLLWAFTSPRPTSALHGKRRQFHTLEGPPQPLDATGAGAGAEAGPGAGDGDGDEHAQAQAHAQVTYAGGRRSEIENAQLARNLEITFHKLSTLLYDTSVAASVLDREVMPMIDENVVFRDPWQVGCGKKGYRLGGHGFHAMLRFTMDIFQVHVHLNPSGTHGRAIVDGIMNLRSFRFMTFPLRTMLVYEFRIIHGEEPTPPTIPATSTRTRDRESKSSRKSTSRASSLSSSSLTPTAPHPRISIELHEEMWSFGDMIEGLPMIGWVYTKVFRRVFALGFLAASWLACKLSTNGPAAR